ncbi:MAG: hypothetical protein MN733_12080 [Nitrososphaera sp.]|nr:hypothetical protein [Nitrososphaera sp.]
MAEDNIQDKESPEDKADAVEREARLQGWVEKDEYRGNADEWVDADTFVKRGREVNPILRANNKRLMAQIDDIKRQNQEMRRTMDEFSAYHADTAKRAYDKALADLKKDKKDAVAAGDVTQALELADRIEDLKEHQPAAKTPATAASQVPQDPSLTAWATKNTWFGNDKVKTQIALAYGEELHSEYPDLRGESFLAELEQRLGAEHPKRFTDFGNPRRNAAPMTSGRGTPSERARNSGKGFSDMPADAQAACNKFVAQKLLTREQYVKDYWEGDES